MDKIKFLMQNILISTDDICSSERGEEGKEILDLLENLQAIKVINYFFL